MFPEMSSKMTDKNVKLQSSHDIGAVGSGAVKSGMD